MARVQLTCAGRVCCKCERLPQAIAKESGFFMRREAHSWRRPNPLAGELPSQSNTQTKRPRARRTPCKTRENKAAAQIEMANLSYSSTPAVVRIQFQYPHTMVQGVGKLLSNCCRVIAAAIVDYDQFIGEISGNSK